MSNRPTPETDALEQKQLNEGCPQWNDMMRWVREHAALARKLEAERDEARERERVAILSFDEERQRALREGERVLEARRERDEARAERDIARLEFEEISNERYEKIQKVLKERDEAREALREIAEASGFDNIGNWARNKALEALKTK